MIFTLLLLPLATGQNVSQNVATEDLKPKEAEDESLKVPTSVEPVSCDHVTIENGAVYRTTDSKLNTTLVFQCHQGYYLHPPVS